MLAVYWCHFICSSVKEESPGLRKESHSPWRDLRKNSFLPGSSYDFPIPSPGSYKIEILLPNEIMKKSRSSYDLVRFFFSHGYG